MPKKASSLPAGAGTLERRYPDVWQCFAELGERAAEAGPLGPRERRLVKLAFAAGAGLEGAVHSHTRRALAEGLSPAELHHAVLLAVPTLGLATAVRAMTWMDDVLEAKRPKTKKKARL